MYITCTVEDKKTFPFGISRTVLLRGVSLTFYVNRRLKNGLKTVIIRFENGTKTATINCKREAERLQNGSKTGKNGRRTIRVREDGRHFCYRKPRRTETMTFRTALQAISEGEKRLLSHIHLCSGPMLYVLPSASFPC